MQVTPEGIRLSASDLANHLGCRHLTFLDLAVVRGELEAPVFHDFALEALQERGLAHEAAYIASLRSQGLSVVRLADDLPTKEAFDQTCAAMREGHEVIVQATLLGDGWMGRADVLRRVEAPAPALGEFSYEVVDTKLARETRGRTILQLCLYSDILGKIQGRRSEWMHVVSPGGDFQPETFRVDDYMAYYRLVRRRLEQATGTGTWVGGDTYPDPCDQCDICRWWQECDRRRHDDDHLSLVAGISKLQIAELEARDIETLESLARARLPLDPKPTRGSAESYERVHHQARVQLDGRERRRPVHEMLPREEGFGLFRLPEPTPRDVFLDLEGAPFAGEQGLEYLFGVAAFDEEGEPQYEPLWALTLGDEKAAFERFIDDAIARWDADEGFHIYHYAPYEPSAIKRLMGRHATREDEVDRLLRGERFVDLYTIARQTVRASVEKYSLKDLEIFFAYERDVNLREASRNLRAIEYALEFEAAEAIPDDVLNVVEGYNRDDCLAAAELRDWLESLRQELIDEGEAIPRPPLLSGEASEELDEALTRVRELAERLTRDVPLERRERTEAQQAQWVLAQLLEWHRREDKAVWWEYFRLVALSDEELFDERAALAGLQFVERLEAVGRGSVIDRYSYPMQETKIRDGDKLRRADEGNEAFGEVVATDPAARTVDIRKGPKMANAHPANVFTHDAVGNRVLRDALLRLGEWVAEHGIEGPGDHQAARDLLLALPPRLRRGTVERVVAEEENALAAARRVALELDQGVLPVQGPPGSGKTYTGARMICEAVRAGKKVGITAVSHKVIRNLLEEVVRAAAGEGVDVHFVEKVTTLSDDPHPAIDETKDNRDVIDRLAGGDAQVAAGTAWLWSREDAFGSLDILFVDEAGQMSLANVLAVAQSAQSIVLLGDPQQLEQPQRGSHPDGTDVSALEHLLGGHLTLPADRGLFLGTTWRLHPSLCAFTSELFYENRLHSREGLEVQALLGETPYAGAGLWHVPAEHDGNQNESPEEADAVAVLVQELIGGGVLWRDRSGNVRPVAISDILIVAPYNAQVAALLERLPRGARVGTVDKFQGQEAPIVIYSMATSSPEEAPRGMEFLYSPSRVNVATSRARCTCILVANPRLFEPECRTPRQMKLANAFCRYLEMAQPAER